MQPTDSYTVLNHPKHSEHKLLSNPTHFLSPFFDSSQPTQFDMESKKLGHKIFYFLEKKTFTGSSCSMWGIQPKSSILQGRCYELVFNFNLFNFEHEIWFDWFFNCVLVWGLYCSILSTIFNFFSSFPMSSAEWVLGMILSRLQPEPNQND